MLSYPRRFVAQSPDWRAAILAALPALAVKMAGVTAYSAGDLAELVGINPADALAKTRSVTLYWEHELRQDSILYWEELQAFVAAPWSYDLSPTVQIVVLAGVEQSLAAALMGEDQP